MNIMYFLTPKAEVDFITEDVSVRQGLEKLRYHGFTVLPVTDRDGHYVGILTEGDVLWALYNDGEPDLKRLEKVNLRKVIRKDWQAVSAAASIDEILSRAYNQNFVPVVDDRKMFIGIITRKAIIRYLAGVKVELQETETNRPEGEASLQN